MANADMILGQAGLTGINKKGAVALVMLKAPDLETGDEPEMVAIVQADDYAAFAKSLNSSKDGELDKATLNDKDVWAKSIGGGFVVLSDDKDRVAKFDGKEGGNARHKKFYGSRADKMTDKADAAVFIDVGALKPLIDAGAEHLEQELSDMGAATGQENAGEMFKWFKDHVVGDMDAGVASFSIDASGVSLDLTGVAKENSKLAGALETSGKAQRAAQQDPRRALPAGVRGRHVQQGLVQLLQGHAQGQGRPDARPGLGAGERPQAHGEHHRRRDGHGRSARRHHERPADPHLRLHADLRSGQGGLVLQGRAPQGDREGAAWQD
ncbi:MAG: hypothetical protein QM783_03425 [Phycisphaerales bacterium]